MKRLLVIINLFALIILIGCNFIGVGKNSNSKNIVSKYNGTWLIEECEILYDEGIIDNEETAYVVGEEIQIGQNAIRIFKHSKSDIRYKLKVVDKSYIISYEYNLTAEKFMGNKDKIDIISVIDQNNILCELVMNSDEEMIMLYKGLLLRLQKISSEANLNSTDIVNSGELVSKDEKEEDVGVMIGLKTPRKLKENGSYTEEEYRTIWISYKDNELQTVYEKEDIIFPRMDGIWRLKKDSYNLDSNHFDYFEVSNLEGKVLANSLNEVESGIYKSIKFVGNDYIAIEEYVGNNFNNIYPIYQIVPINNINTEVGLTIEEIFNAEANLKYSNDFKNAFLSLSEDEKSNLSSSIDYSNITMERDEGKWILKGKIPPLENDNPGIDFKLSLKPNNKLLNFNSLLIPWKNLKGEGSLLKDAFTSPEGNIAIIRLKDYLAVYRISNGQLEGSPLFNIPLMKGEEVIMAEWCSSFYVDEWRKSFIDGYVISE